MFRRLSMLGAVLLSSVVTARMPAFFDFEPMSVPQAERIARSASKFAHPSGAKMQRHTGAGGQGAHRRWKVRRAAGIY